MKRWKLMISAPYMQPVPERCLRALIEHGAEVVVVNVNERLSEQELLEVIADFDAVICGDDRFTERVLFSAPKLKVISKWGTGIDSIDQEACRRRGIIIRNTPNAFSEPVADSVLGYMLCFARKLRQMDQMMQMGGWQKIPGVSLGECTLGVIGVGNVGKAVVRRAKAFGMTIVGSDPIEPPKEFLLENGIEMVEKEELLRRSDFVSLNCDLNPTSRHLIDESNLVLMKPTSVLINLARGPIVKESALIWALVEGYLAGAALDVFEEEPLSQESPLRAMPNVLLAPHNSNSSPRAWDKVHDNSVTNVLDVMETCI